MDLPDGGRGLSAPESPLSVLKQGTASRWGMWLIECCTPHPPGKVACRDSDSSVTSQKTSEDSAEPGLGHAAGFTVVGL